jgi:uncharacterized protein (DUF2252 family)
MVATRTARGSGRAAKTARPRASGGWLSPAERAARGKAARAEVPRESHAGFEPGPQRKDPVSLLEQQARSRVPDLVPIRYGRMLASAFSYFRGAALPMAADLAATPSTGLLVQACGDAHLSNFGLFASPERNLVFDVNDFDESLPGPWEWDVKRLAASLEVAARDNGFSRPDRTRIVMAAAGKYREAMREFAGQGNLAVWYAHADVERVMQDYQDQIRSRQRKLMGKIITKARTRDSRQELGKLTRLVDGRLRIVADPPLVVPLSDLLPEQLEGGDPGGLLRTLIASYARTLQPDRRELLEQYEFADMARKVVGVGSVGTRCWIVLLLGRDASDPLFLQVKEAQKSVLSPFAGASKITNQGERVVAGQRLTQAASDIFLGWQRVTGADGRTRDFYVRQLRDWKFSLPIEAMIPRGMRIYAQLCGWTLARAHARSGDRIAIAAYLGRSAVFERAVTEFAVAYADQNERDYRRLAQAAADGRITAEQGI